MVCRPMSFVKIWRALFPQCRTGSAARSSKSAQNSLVTVVHIRTECFYLDMP